MALSPKFKRGVNICCTVTTILIAALIITAVIIYFTILKPKQPKITTKSVMLDNIELAPFPFHLNITLGITVIIDNRKNYGSFKYKNSTTYVSYRGDDVADAQILADTIPARGTHEVAMTVLLMGEKMISDPNFLADFENGELNFISSTTLHGVARVWKIIEVKATTFSTCNITVLLVTNTATSVCSSKLKF